VFVALFLGTDRVYGSDFGLDYLPGRVTLDSVGESKMPQCNLSRPVETAQPLDRRLSDKIMTAFRQACDQRNLGTAVLLLRALEHLVSQAPMQGMERRRSLTRLVNAHEQLWRLRHAANDHRNVLD
jgi:hypothetical protein